MRSLFIAWSLALLCRARPPRAGRATAPPRRSPRALAAVLALAIQTDVIGVPWLAYCLWWLAGALVWGQSKNVLTKAQLPASSHSNGLVGDREPVGVVAPARDVVARDHAAHALVGLERT